MNKNPGRGHTRPKEPNMPITTPGRWGVGNVLHFTGWSHSKLYAKIKDGTFPPPLKDGRINYWNTSVLREVLWTKKRPSELGRRTSNRKVKVNMPPKPLKEQSSTSAFTKVPKYPPVKAEVTNITLHKALKAYADGSYPLKALKSDFEKEWTSYRNMHERVKKFKLEVDEQFYSFPGFLEVVGPIPIPGYTLDRIDPSGGYTAQNVRWASKSMQSNNRKNVKKIVPSDGAEWTLSGIAAALQISYMTVYRRYREGWTADELVNGVRKKKLSSPNKPTCALLNMTPWPTTYADFFETFYQARNTSEDRLTFGDRHAERALAQINEQVSELPPMEEYDYLSPDVLAQAAKLQEAFQKWTALHCTIQAILRKNGKMSDYRLSDANEAALRRKYGPKSPDPCH